MLKNAFYCHSERSEESWLGSNPTVSDENISERKPQLVSSE